MKLLDRYVVGSFLKNYVISFVVVVGMCIILDMTLKFDELAEMNAKQHLTGLAATVNFIRYVGDFYFYQGFLYFMHLSGIIPIVAASFTLMRMVRFNELSALLSAGVPMLRIAMPIIVAALCLNGLVWVDQEFLVPNMIHKLVRSHDYGADVGYFEVSAMRDGRGGKLFATRYYPTHEPPRMEQVTVIETNQADRPVSLVKADRALWDAQSRHWKLETTLVDPLTGKSQAIGGRKDINLLPTFQTPIKTISIDYYQSDVINPEELQLYRKSSFVELLSTAHINELLKRPESYGRAALLRVKHGRGAVQIMLNMIILLLAIGSVMTREPQQLKMAVSRCVILCALCVAVAFGAQELAGKPPHLSPQLADKWPAMMAWLPIFIFGPISIWLLDRMKT